MLHSDLGGWCGEKLNRLMATVLNLNRNPAKCRVFPCESMGLPLLQHGFVGPLEILEFLLCQFLELFSKMGHLVGVVAGCLSPVGVFDFLHRCRAPQSQNGVRVPRSVRFRFFGAFVPLGPVIPGALARGPRIPPNPWNTASLSSWMRK